MSDRPLDSKPDDDSSSVTDTESSNPGKSEQTDESKKSFSAIKDVYAIAEKNSRYRRQMEDEHVIFDKFGGRDDCAFFGVYDGHGGKLVVEYVAKHLHENLLKELKSNEYKDIPACLTKAFKQTDAQITEQDIQISGTTAVVGLILKDAASGKRKLFVANCGDARGVICKNGVAERLSHDHKATDADETKRILEAGGFIIMNRVNGILAVARSLGDINMKEYVIADPYITETELTDETTHLILACDGLWDVCKDQEGVDIVKELKSAQIMAEKLLVHAINNRSTDNITIMGILL